MVNITLSLPEKTHSQMQEFPEIRWSEVARRAIVEKIDALYTADRFTKKDKPTLDDSKELQKKIKSGRLAK